jgi:hypothetical protein
MAPFNAVHHRDDSPLGGTKRARAFPPSISASLHTPKPSVPANRYSPWTRRAVTKWLPRPSFTALQVSSLSPSRYTPLPRMAANTATPVEAKATISAPGRPVSKGFHFVPRSWDRNTPPPSVAANNSRPRDARAVTAPFVKPESDFIQVLPVSSDRSMPSLYTPANRVARTFTRARTRRAIPSASFLDQSFPAFRDSYIPQPSIPAKRDFSARTIVVGRFEQLSGKANRPPGPHACQDLPASREQKDPLSAVSTARMPSSPPRRRMAPPGGPLPDSHRERPWPPAQSGTKAMIRNSRPGSLRKLPPIMSGPEP